ncbi:MAG: hypothetical protein HY067_00410 [Betaproteobacteria bacterium]|nr:hypothetical protein [Betaproteobacteria bacterium]
MLLLSVDAPIPRIVHAPQLAGDLTSINPAAAINAMMLDTPAGILQERFGGKADEVQHLVLGDRAGGARLALILFGLWMFLARRMAGEGGIGGDLMSIGKIKVKVYLVRQRCNKRPRGQTFRAKIESLTYF